jgi:RNA polymerase sigma-70 factor (ECF subfamily)
LPAFLHRLRADETLMLRYGEGDVSAFTELYQRHKDGLYRFVLRSAHEPALAEDVAQETWTAVIRGAADYRVEAAFRTWLYTIARRKLTDHHRRQQRAPTDSLDHSPTEIHAPGAALEEHVQVQRLLQLITELPEDQRQAFVLKEEGFSLREIAGILDSGEETLKSRIRYARATLRSAMGVDDES